MDEEQEYLNELKRRGFWLVKGAGGCELHTDHIGYGPADHLGYFEDAEDALFYIKEMKLDFSEKEEKENTK